jgi:ligand-binding sensor domain-containing protein
MALGCGLIDSDDSNAKPSADPHTDSGTVTFQTLGEWVNFISGSTVSAAVEGPDDAWFGTSAGLVRYRKREQSWLYYDRINSGLPCNDVLSLALDGEGRLWVGTHHNGLASFDGENWNTLNFPDQQAYAPAVEHLHVDADGVLWASASNGKLYRFDGVNWASYFVSDPASERDDITAIGSDEKGQFWVATYKGVGGFDPATGTRALDNTAPFANDIRTALVTRKGELWVGSSQGLARRSGGTWNVYTPTNSDLPSEEFWSMNEAADDTMWFGTIKEVAQYAEPNWHTYPLPGPNLSPVLALAPASDGATWVGTYAQGLYRFAGGAFTSQSTTPSGFPGQSVNAIVEDDKGSIWVGTESGLAVRKSGRWSTSDGKISLLQSGIFALAPNPADHSLWMGTAGGVYRYDGTTLQVWDPTYSALPSSVINAVLVDSQGQTWAATAGGVATYNGKKWSAFTRSNSALPSNQTNALARDTHGNIWIGLGADWVNSARVPGGLARYDGKTFEIFNTANSGLPTDNVLGVAVDENDVVWVATGSPDDTSNQDEGGLASFDGTTWRTFSISNSPLPNNYVRSVASDNHGTIWIGTNRGLAKYSHDQWQVFHHSDSGLSDDVILTTFVDSRGNTWIGTAYEGLSVYRPGGVQLLN